MAVVATRERGTSARDGAGGPGCASWEEGSRAGSAGPPPDRLFEPAAGPTLEDFILASWGELAAEGRTSCPVCGGSMPASGGCEGCGAELC